MSLTLRRLPLAAGALAVYHHAVIYFFSRETRIGLVGAAATAGVLYIASRPPISQSQRFHRFADGRRWCCGVPNSSDVLSNGAFLLALVPCRSVEAFETHELCELRAHFTAYAGVSAVALGSAYYHLRPDDSRLAWDRMPMTIAFTSLLSIALSDTIGPEVGCTSLGPFVLAGVGTVVYWMRTGDLRPYYVCQYLTLALVLLLQATFEARYTLQFVGYALLLTVYLTAKLTEASDVGVFQATRGIISGHTLKHLLAAIAMMSFYAHLAMRSPLH